jgi:hypothetical protein
MTRSNRWKQIGLGAGFLAVIASPEALHALSAAPDSRPSAKVAPAQAAADNSFVPACKANEVADTRPDPAWVGASFARDNCWAPPIPARLDGYAASRDQIVAGMAAVTKYKVLSDAYQKCIGNFVAARKAEADQGKKPLNASLVLIETHRITVAQENKKKAQNQIDGAIEAFNEYGSECL